MHPQDRMPLPGVPAPLSHACARARVSVCSVRVCVHVCVHVHACVLKVWGWVAGSAPHPWRGW